MVEKSFEMRQLAEIIPYENNPRINDDAVRDVMESIKQTGNLDPIEVDEDYVILSGHTRLKALINLGYTETEIIKYTGLSDAQKRKYRLLANKTGEKALWDLPKLDVELAGLDFEGYDFGFAFDDEFENSEECENPYTMKIHIPQYEPKGECPDIADMLNNSKATELVKRIESATGITEEERKFLVSAAYRHNVFNYRNIAEYYCHATPEMQALMEESALVIIDVDNAIANGYVKLNAELQEMIDGDGNA